MILTHAIRWAAARPWAAAVPLAGYYAGRSMNFVSARVPRRAGTSYKPHAGPFEVAAVDLIVRDGRRGKDVRVRAYAPAGGGTAPRPVIVVSHGLACGGTDLSIASRYWASHGLAAVHPTHEDSNHLRTPDEAARRWPGGVRRWVGRNPDAWRDRCADLSLMIDALGEIERHLPGVRLDADRVGVAGHSYGADMAQLLAGMRVVPGAGAESLSFADPRVRATLVMAGSGRDALTPDRDCWQHVSGPMMAMAGGEDWLGRRRGPAWRAEPFRFSPPGGKYLLVVDRANHLTFTLDPADHHASHQRRRRRRRCGGTDANANAGGVSDPSAPHAVIRAASLAFWDAHLLGCPLAAEYLSAGRIAPPGGPSTQLRCR